MIEQQLLPSSTPSVETKVSSAKNLFRVAAYLLLLSLVLRLPFFFHGVVNWDESTYILMGQSVLDGHLPYTEMWEVKPPLTFVFYALFIVVFGKSIISVRIAGALWVALASFLTYLVGKAVWNWRVGILGATLWIFLASLLPGGQAVMTEHVALVPLIGALCLLVTQKPTPRILFFVGILMAIASLVRLNLAYVAVIVGFFALWEKPRRPIQPILQRGLAYAAGGCLMVGLTYFPYAVTGNSQVWWSSVIEASLSYANSQLSVLGTLKAHLNYFWRTFSEIRGTLFGVSVVMWVGGLAGMVLNFAQWRNISQEQRRGLIWLLLFIIGTGISIIKGGAAYGHYLIQLVPFMGLFAAAFIDIFLPRRLRWLTASAVVLALAIAAKPIAAEYGSLLSRSLANQKLTTGSAYEIAAYLQEENATGETIYMMSDHIVYWLVDAKIPSKFVHPSAIGKDYLLDIIVGSPTSSKQEMEKILAQNPKFIVKTEKPWYLRGRGAARSLLKETLQTKYRRVEQIQDRQIYRRIDRP